MVWDFAASPSPYWVSISSKSVPSNALRNPASLLTVESVAAFTFTIPILPDVTPASLSAFNISFPAVVPAASLSVEKVASASTFAGESTYTILMPASFASFSAEEIASGPFAATMIA